MEMMGVLNTWFFAVLTTEMCGSPLRKKIVREKAAAWVRPGQQRSLALGGWELRMFFLFLQYAMIHSKRTSKQTSEYLLKRCSFERGII
jgi:hypothetical protein